MAASRILLLCLFGVFLLPSDALRSFVREAEPEDSLLEEIASYMRRQNHQQKSQKLRDFSEENGFLEKKFAYRPDEPQFQKTWPPRAPIRKTSFRPGIQEIRSSQLGEKENIDFINNVATPLPASTIDQHVHESQGFQAAAIANEETSDDGDKNTKLLENHDVDDNLDKPRNGPVAHAIISPQGRDVNDSSLKDIYFTALVAGCTAAVVTVTIGFGVCIYSWQKSRKLAQEVEYPAYGITGPGPMNRGGSVKKSGSGGLKATSPKKAGHGDKKLAHSAHMFHFQHQKQQVIAMENNSIERGGSNSGAESDEEDNEEGDYTVYECPGLAPTGEMEVKNPLFSDDPTPLEHSADRKNT